MRSIVAVAAFAAVLLTAPVHATSDFCGVVKPTPDGYLNLRRAPGAGHEGTFRLAPGDKLSLDTASCETLGGRDVCDDSQTWVHVTSVRRVDAAGSKLTQGWVHGRFVEQVPCEAPERATRAGIPRAETRIARFEDYPATAYRGPLAPPDLSDKDAWRFRTRIREGAAGPVRFGGRYRVAGFGCGMGCGIDLLIDPTGKVIWLTKLVGDAGDSNDYNEIETRPNSNMFRLKGVIWPKDDQPTKIRESDFVLEGGRVRKLGERVRVEAETERSGDAGSTPTPTPASTEAHSLRPDWRRISNRRFGVSVEVPLHLVADGFSHDMTDGHPGGAVRLPSGIRMSADHVDIALYGQELDPAGPYSAMCGKGCDGQTYALKRATVAVAFGRRESFVWYRRCRVSASGSAFACFELEYPEARKREFDGVVERMNDTLR